MPSFPSSVYSRPDPIPALMSTVPTHSTILGQYGDEIEQIEGTLGINPQGAFATVAARLDEAPTTWSLTAVGQPGPVSCTTSYGWKKREVGGLFHAQIKIVFSAGGVAGNRIQMDTPYTLANLESIGGTGSYFDSGTTIYNVNIWPVSTTVMALQVTGNGGQLGVLPNIAIASPDALHLTMTGRAA